MRERPIIFSGTMVRSILEGRKTQTRRLIKEPEDWELLAYFGFEKEVDGQHSFRVDHPIGCYNGSLRCPYGVPGDRLWVRETWTPHEKSSGHDGILYRADGSFVGIKNTKGAADDWLAVWDGEREHKWRPSIFMPRWASRITLKVKDVRVERLQDISEDDAQKEGVTPSIVGKNLDGLKYRSGFQTIWDSINNKRGYGWNSNPWVWVVEFRVI